MSSQLDVEQARKATSALLDFVEKQKGKQQVLLNDKDQIWLIVGVKKVPRSSVKPKRIPLPRTLYPPGDSEICLFTKDPKDDVRRQLEEKGVTRINKVISLSKLRKSYKTHEAKRQLSSMYDLFLCDERIYHLLPRHLGKKFFEKKKRPHPVNMTYINLREEIRKAVDATYLHLGHGPCSAVPIGNTGMGVEDVIENVARFSDALGRVVPRGWSNVKSVHMKTADSMSLPIFLSLPRPPTAIPSVAGPEPQRKRKRTAPPSRPVRT